MSYPREDRIHLNQEEGAWYAWIESSRSLYALAILGPSAVSGSEDTPDITPLPPSTHLEIQDAEVAYVEDLDLLVFGLSVKGRIGGILPEGRGSMNGAPVLGYVFPTSLASTDVGFGTTDGIVALAVTSHPDFDDTPLWDENGDRDYKNEGVVFHPHWVVLSPDKRVAGGLAVKQFQKADGVVLPPTNPGMPM